MRKVFVLSALVILILGCGGGGNKKPEPEYDIISKKKGGMTLTLRHSKKLGLFYHLNPGSIIVTDEGYNNTFESKKEFVEFWLNEKKKIRAKVFGNGNVEYEYKKKEGNVKLDISKYKKEDNIEDLTSRLKAKADSLFNLCVTF